MQLSANELQQLEKSLGLPQTQDDVDHLRDWINGLRLSDDQEIVIRSEEETVIEFDWPSDAELDFESHGIRA